jgi:hypothetical protein
VALDEGYCSLGATPQERTTRYRTWVREAISEGEWEDMQPQAINRGQGMGRDRFVGEVAKKIGRRIERRLSRYVSGANAITRYWSRHRNCLTYRSP